MKDINIVPMKKEHIEDVLKIEELSFSVQWSREAFIQEVMHNKLARYLVIIEDNRVIAYGGMWFILDEAHITNIAVHPKYRRKGKGRQLVSALIDLASDEGIDQLTLEVRRSNYAAISLYESFGFETVGVRKEFYFDNKEDAFIMWRR
jgi:ribosomal-protein-alanine N-acetyltransferase